MVGTDRDEATMYASATQEVLTLNFHVHTAVQLDNYQSFFTNWCTIG